MKTAGAAVLIILAVASVYAGTLSHPLVWDDCALITDNPGIRHFSRWGEFLAGDLHGEGGRGYWRPLTGLSFALNWRLGGTDPFGYHLFNVGFHCLNCLLLYFFFRGLLSPAGALTGSLLFAVHPAAVSVTAYVSGRADLLATGAILAGLLASRTGGGKPRVLTPICFALALGAREGSLIFPLLLIWSHRTEGRKPAAGPLIGCALVLAGYAALRLVLLPPAHLHLEAATTLWSLPELLLRYLRLALFPHRLHMLRWFPAPEPGGTRFFLAAGATTGLALLAWVNPWLRRGAAWFLIALIPVLGFLPLAAPLAENWLYLPAVGLALAAGGGLESRRRGRFRPLAEILFAAVVVLFALQAGLYARLWADPVILYRRTIEADPPTSPAHARGRRLEGAFANLGNELALRGQAGEALAALERARNVNPHHYPTLDATGRVLRRLGRYREGEQAFLAALALRPNAAATCSNLGRLYLDVGLDESAEPLLEKALVLEPGSGEALNNLGLLRRRSGDPAGARNLWEKALRVDPKNAAARGNLARLKDEENNHPGSAESQRLFELGTAWEKRGDLAQATACYRGAGRHAESHLALGLLEKRAGRTAEAAQQYRLALGVRADLAAAWVNLAILHADLGFLREAELECRQAVQADPDCAPAFNAWGRVLGETGDLAGACRKFKRALQIDPELAEAARNLGKARAAREKQLED